MNVRAQTEQHVRIAVVIPCHNDGATLPETLDSLRQQEQCEVVVVDDGSDAGDTLAVLAEVERRLGIRVIRQPNRGPGAARTAGAAATTARYVFPLDADDLVVPGALAALADALDGDDALALAWGDTQMFGGATHLSRKVRDVDPWLLSHLNPLPTATLVRRRALDEVGGWSPDVGYEDWDLWMSLAERGWRGRHVGRVVALHRVRDSSRFAHDRERHERIVAELRRRHPALFARRAAAWRSSVAPRRFRLLLPLIAHLPLSARDRYRLTAVVDDPRTAVKLLGRRLVGHGR
jgi:glycosyltransferase involved in cell wall biosynthesis